MQQPPIRRCSRCGTASSAEQRFCSNCGAVIDRDVANPTAPASEQDFAQHPGITMPPPPPNIDHYPTSRQQSNYTPVPPPDVPSYHQQPTDGSFTPPAYPGMNQGQPLPPAGYPVPGYAQAPRKDNTGKILGRIGCGAGLLILLALLICGGLSYGLYAMVSKSASNVSRSYSTSANNLDVTPTPSPIKTTSLNLALKYATIAYTIVDMKQSASFVDDRSNNAPGVVRVDLKEVNSTSDSVYLTYTEAAHLVLPNGNSVAPQNYKSISPPANGASQDNWLDFPVPLGTATDKLVLRFGTPQEAQMDVPLIAGTDLAKFQDVTIKPGTATNYSGLKWTLSTATLGWSSSNKQAENGKRYVVINVSVDNPTTAAKTGYWGDYLRLKAGNTTSAPETNSTIPTSFAAGSTGITGVASFLVPQDNSTFTLILLADKIDTGTPQATIDFHIP